MATDGNLEVRHTLSPCTTEFAYVRCTFENPSREVVFVDTPPFPDPWESKALVSDEQKVGDSISEWIKEA